MRAVILVLQVAVGPPGPAGPEGRPGKDGATSVVVHPAVIPHGQ